MKTTAMKSTAKWVAGVAAMLLSAWCMTHDDTPKPLPDDAGLPRSTGWRADPAEVDRLLESLPEPRFCRTPAGRAALGPTSDVYLWKAAVAVTGRTLPPRDQGQVGACVGFAAASAIEHLICVQIASEPANERRSEYRDLAPEVIYGGSRVQVGGGRIGGDGSVGAWAADFSRRWGVLPRGRYERDTLDLTTYRESTCRQLGRTGLPAGMLALAKQYPVRSVSQVSTAAEAKQALRQGYPLIVCSNRGFSLERDPEGFCRPSGRWNHAMAVLGWRGGARPGFFILNSWGEGVYRGPTGAGDGPKCGFWADENVVDQMLSQGDSWAFSDAAGFPVRPLDTLDWFVQAHPEERLTRRE